MTVVMGLIYMGVNWIRIELSDVESIGEFIINVYNITL